MTGFLPFLFALTIVSPSTPAIVAAEQTARQDEEADQEAPSLEHESEAVSSEPDSRTAENEERDQDFGKVVLSYHMPDESNPDNLPLLVVYESGVVHAMRHDATAPPAEIVISAAQLERLNRTIVRQQRFGRFDEEQFARQRVEMDQRFPGCAMSPEMKIVCHFGANAHEVTVGAAYVGLHIQFPENEQLQNFAATEKTCRALMYTAIAGGFEEIDSILEAVNEDLKDKHQRLPRFEWKHLDYASTNEDGTVYVLFKSETNGRRQVMYITADWTGNTHDVASGTVSIELVANPR
ncbi:MAG: hypothetical protein AAF456_21870 [Planctomycetota bacterium]